MELSVRDLADLLKVSEKIVFQWIKSSRIPAYKIRNEYRFNKSEVGEWILHNNVQVSEEVLALFSTTNPIELATLMTRGGVHSDIGGEAFSDVLGSIVERIPVPPGCSKPELFQALLLREQMVPTAIGKGIAIPHPRDVIVTEIDCEQMSVCFLRAPVSCGAVDSEPVHTVFVTLCATPRRHLESLSRLSFLCQNEEFIRLLKQKPPQETLIEFVSMQEREWKRRRNNDR